MKTALGYHGTSKSVATKILNGSDKFRPKRNSGDWLSSGVYFWQDGPGRAYYWAERRFKATAVVLRAEIDLSSCLDLLDLDDFAEIHEIHKTFLQFEQDSGLQFSQQPLHVERGVTKYAKGETNLFVNDRDQTFLEFAIPLLEKERGKKITSIRAAFLMGRGLHTTSYLFSWAHVQICVLDDTIISNVEVVPSQV